MSGWAEWRFLRLDLYSTIVNVTETWVEEKTFPSADLTEPV